MRGKVAATLGGAVVALVLLAPAQANATFHLMKIREVSLGSTAAGFNDAFVELQMHQGGQQFVSGKELRFYDGGGDPVSTFTFPTVSGLQGESQRTILIGDSSVPGGVDIADTAMAGRVLNSNAACFVDPGAPPALIDCVAWGTFDDSAQVTRLPVGTPAAAMGSGQSLVRSIARRCPTLLEAGDDTGSSAADFVLTVPSPRLNAATPTETACTVPTFAINGPSGTTDRTPKFRFTPSEPVTGVQCKVDSASYASCSSPFTTRRLAIGRHTLRVRGTATDDAVVGTSSKRFKVKRRR